MPHLQYAARRLRQHVITLQDVCRANNQITDELDNLGLWSDRLDKIVVYWVPASWDCYGWFNGHICIPAITGARLSDFLGGKYTRLTDVLRHEWAHAVADRHKRLIETTRFERAFGGPYESDDAVRQYDPAHHLTPYAAVNPCEDFAEVFHYYLRHKGRLPVRLANKPRIIRKWKFVEWLARQVSG